MRLRYLRPEEKAVSRRLYENCFPEDTPKFVDYYYAEKCRDNEIIVLEQGEKICSMIHANPFPVSCCKNRVMVHYLVAVATDPAYRRQGCMRKLLRQTLQDARDRQEPFSFLMPADPAYYEPFGYRYWNGQQVWEISALQEEKLQTYCAGAQPCLSEIEEEQLAECANRILDAKFDLYIPRDASYYERMKKEQQSEDGKVMAVYDGRGAVSGSFCYSMEDGFEIREPLFGTDTRMPGSPTEILTVTEQKKPLMMGRIVHLPAFVSMLRFADVYEQTVQIRDELLPENDGCYRIRIDYTGGRAEKAEPCEAAVTMDIAGFGRQMFDRLKIFVNELV